MRPEPQTMTWSVSFASLCFMCSLDAMRERSPERARAMAVDVAKKRVKTPPSARAIVNQRPAEERAWVSP